MKKTKITTGGIYNISGYVALKFARFLLASGKLCPFQGKHEFIFVKVPRQCLKFNPLFTMLGNTSSMHESFWYFVIIKPLKYNDATVVEKCMVAMATQ